MDYQITVPSIVGTRNGKYPEVGYKESEFKYPVWENGQIIYKTGKYVVPKTGHYTYNFLKTLKIVFNMGEW